MKGVIFVHVAELLRAVAALVAVVAALLASYGATDTTSPDSSTDISEVGQPAEPTAPRPTPSEVQPQPTEPPVIIAPPTTTVPGPTITTPSVPPPQAAPATTAPPVTEAPAQPPAEPDRPVPPEAAPAPPSPITEPRLTPDGLDQPWGLAFLPDGSALVTERDSRRIHHISPTGEIGEVATISEAVARNEGGLMGIAVSPQYQQDQTVFIYYTTSEDNRIATLTPGGRPTPIVTGIPAAPRHDGGRLGFGPDGFLYASTGDGLDPSSAQNLDSLGGKILRMTLDGQPAPGNPFPDSLVWSYGHRNVQGFAWDSSQRMYATEFGENQWDEVNRIEPGGNYGWPEVEGESSDSRFRPPLVTWQTSEASPSRAAIVNDVLLVAALRGERLWQVALDGQGGIAGQPQALHQGQWGRLRHVTQAPDGSVWVVSESQGIHAIPPPGGVTAAAN